MRAVIFWNGATFPKTWPSKTFPWWFWDVAGLSGCRFSKPLKFEVFPTLKQTQCGELRRRVWNCNFKGNMMENYNEIWMSLGGSLFFQTTRVHPTSYIFNPGFSYRMERLLAIAGKPGLSWAQQAPTSGQDSPQSGDWSMGQATWIKMDGALSGRATSELNSRCGHFFGARKCTCGGSSARFYEIHQYSTIWPSCFAVLHRLWSWKRRHPNCSATCVSEHLWPVLFDLLVQISTVPTATPHWNRQCAISLSPSAPLDKMSWPRWLFRIAPQQEAFDHLESRETCLPVGPARHKF